MINDALTHVMDAVILDVLHFLCASLVYHLVSGNMRNKAGPVFPRCLQWKIILGLF